MSITRFLAEFLDPEIRRANKAAKKSNEEWLAKLEAGASIHEFPRIIDESPIWSPKAESWMFSSDSAVLEGRTVLFRQGRGGLRGELGIVGEVFHRSDDGTRLYKVQFENEWDEDA
jgi:hypothetical protein